MCETCGCGEGVGHDANKQMLVLESSLLARNDALANHNRQWLASRNVRALNIISSPGSGKTLLLEKTLERLDDQISCGVIVGDLQTDRDAQRLAFHRVVLSAAEQMVMHGLEKRPSVRQLVLTGGVFMNALLAESLPMRLRRRGVAVWMHENIPPNDGGIALGQVFVAGRR